MCAFCVCHYRICLEPASVSPHEWPDDITKWPVSKTVKPCLGFRRKEGTRRVEIIDQVV